ncbi:hypothetical protein M413DRAFT_33076 [Hebeloma cylindrosporum]|uniref:Uncharacterized protein n=1 Tax=Hebeloma cylindrosporum TaxID=76867 RepID=A0A0C2X9L2_HEBCY|nr:hypothetical protein M413DRAFT_33076 [Hebeloma cylindrosporum h7]
MQQPVDVQQRPITPDIIVVDIKAEPRSPTPPLPQPKLVTESCEFYPLPESCQKSNPDYRENRKRFFQEKNSHLISLGLKKTKVFYRDDGLVIEWTSKVPVWSDTLQPDIPDLATAIQLAHTINHDLSNKSQKHKRPTPVDESPAKKPSIPSKSSKSSHTIQTHWASGVPADQLEAVSRLGSAARKPPSQAKKPIPLPTRRNGAVPMKPLSASAVAFSPRATSAPPSAFPTSGSKLEKTA